MDQWCMVFCRCKRIVFVLGLLSLSQLIFCISTWAEYQTEKVVVGIVEATGDGRCWLKFPKDPTARNECIVQRNGSFTDRLKQLHECNISSNKRIYLFGVKTIYLIKQIDDDNPDARPQPMAKKNMNTLKNSVNSCGPIAPTQDFVFKEVENGASYGSLFSAGFTNT